MPVVDFEELPDAARVWIFPSDRPLRDMDAQSLREVVKEFLAHWKAHGAPLRGAFELRDDRFLVIGIDPTVEQASGCSIDALFRGLQAYERWHGTRLLAGGRVFYRDANGEPQRAERAELSSLAARGLIGQDTPVFDTSITDARTYRERFERPARETWVGSLLVSAHESQSSSRSATKSSSAKNG